MFSSRVAIANILFLTFTMGLGMVHIAQPNLENNMYNIHPIQLNYNNTLSGDFKIEKDQFQSKNNQISVLFFFILLANILNWFN